MKRSEAAKLIADIMGHEEDVGMLPPGRSDRHLDYSWEPEEEYDLATPYAILEALNES